MSVKHITACWVTPFSFRVFSCDFVSVCEWENSLFVLCFVCWVWFICEVINSVNRTSLAHSGWFCRDPCCHTSSDTNRLVTFIITIQTLTSFYFKADSCASEKCASLFLFKRTTFVLKAQHNQCQLMLAVIILAYFDA